MDQEERFDVGSDNMLVRGRSSAVTEAGSSNSLANGGEVEFDEDGDVFDNNTNVETTESNMKDTEISILNDLADVGGGTEWSGAAGVCFFGLVFGLSRLVEFFWPRMTPSWLASFQWFTLVSDVAVWYGTTSFQLAACSRLVENSSITMQAITAWLQVTSGGLLLVPAVLHSGRKLFHGVPYDFLLCLAISGLCFMIGTFCVMQGLAATSTAFVGGARCLEPFTTIILGIFFGLAADFQRLQILASMSAVVGVLLLNFGLMRHGASVTGLLSTIMTMIWANIMFSSRNVLVSLCHHRANISKAALLGFMCLSGSLAGLYVVVLASFTSDNQIFHTGMKSFMTFDMATSILGFVLYNTASIYVLCRVQVLMHAMFMSGKRFFSVVVACALNKQYLDGYAIFGIACLVGGAALFELSKSSNSSSEVGESKQDREAKVALRVKSVGDLSPKIVAFVAVSMLAVPVCMFANHRTVNGVGKSSTLELSAIYQGPVYSIHYDNLDNVGDHNSAPGKWWRDIMNAAGVKSNSTVTIKGLKFAAPTGSMIVVGGGGMLANSYFEDDIIESLDHSGPVAFWGMGLNKESETPPDVSMLPPVVARIKNKASSHHGKFFFSMRDYDPQQRWRWVPCASCMNPMFTSASLLGEFVRAISEQLAGGLGMKEKVGVIKHVVATGEYCGQHVEQWVSEGLLTQQDVTRNDGTDMNRILRFIKKYDVIVTTSYHSTFWATLLGKKVVVCNGWSSKLYYLKHPPVFYSGNLENDIQKAKRYPEALHEARDASIQFAQEVMSQA